MPLSDIVNVQITRQTQSVSEMGFGIPLILGITKRFNDLLRKYFNLQQVSVDFNPYDPEFIAAQNIFSQNITPQYIYIGRRTVDTAGIEVETALPNKNYTVTINGTNATINSTTEVQDSVVTLTGIMTYTLTFSTDFNSSTTAITPIVNGVTLASTAWTTNQATTIAAVATVIGAAPGVTSSTASGDVITVVFAASATATVNSVGVTGTGSQPTCVITNAGPLVASNSIAVVLNGVTLTGSPFTYATSSLATLTAIAAAIATKLNTGYTPGIATATVTGVNNNILTITSNPNQAGVVSSFVVTSGASQATAGIVNTAQPTDANTIANALAAEINGLSLGVTASTPSTPNGTLSITANVSGVPYTLAVSTTLTLADQYRVTITQATPNQTYTATINGTGYSYAAPTNVSTNDQISAALVASINSPILLDENLNPIMFNSETVPNPIYNIIDASDNSNGSFELFADTPGNTFLLQVSPFEAMTIQLGLIIQPYQPSASAVSDIQAIQAVNDDWYGLICTDRTSATVQAIAAYIETQIKIFGTSSSDLNIINQAPGTDTTSIAALFNNAGYVRTFVLYHQDAAEDYPEAAWFGAVLPLQPGSETWKFKNLRGIAYSTLSGTQESNAFGKSCNTYEFVGGVGITQNGTVAQGEYIDTVRGVDWLTSTIQSYVYSALVNNPKVPYTDAGITAIEGQIMQALQLGVDNNFIASSPPYHVFVPLAANVPTIDKTNRVLNNVSFNATLAGAIQAVFITGTVSV